MTDSELKEAGFVNTDRIPFKEIAENINIHLIETPFGWHAQIEEEPEFSSIESQVVNVPRRFHTIEQLNQFIKLFTDET